MKIELEVMDCDALVISALRQSLYHCSGGRHPEDKKYEKKYRKAVNFVLEHFGAAIED